jgi:hypothetical protein
MSPDGLARLDFPLRVTAKSSNFSMWRLLQEQPAGGQWATLPYGF